MQKMLFFENVLTSVDSFHVGKHSDPHSDDCATMGIGLGARKKGNSVASTNAGHQ